jgi:MFS transporter, DHA2 family, multidrug resistance protein
MSALTRQSSGPAATLDVPTLPSKHTGLLMAAVMGISICQFLDLTIANVALPHMRTSLGASMESISWVLTSYIIAGVLVLPLTGWLSDRLGSRNLFVWASTAFVLASMLCGAATSLEQMVLFRAIQGVASAFIGPLSQTIMFDINRPSKNPAAGVSQMVSLIINRFGSDHGPSDARRYSYLPTFILRGLTHIALEFDAVEAAPR